ncbi:hypothetical protein GUITHDRAFT_141409 [Guillardia theta CCMP2712]|uniref:Uncharacterized protein n=1 Tax=Guillardia theta (strain CCMP2712) TaxID=905079 RepID=L1J107_GUITC|nr:hypothetical protein GUITHDRAFT_141409 [Guillardia theta CCMP2712]EKX42206.1 hypothetical protein GUITHDRAFT_141409 [Guillardia theta CCMP2712]|eukprot:XP_005829186.1 hypothetical protein GUITHDRAFT_141409 [Guillardia theta CCMP2712]
MSLYDRKQQTSAPSERAMDILWAGEGGLSSDAPPLEDEVLELKIFFFSTAINVTKPLKIVSRVQANNQEGQVPEFPTRKYQEAPLFESALSDRLNFEERLAVAVTPTLARLRSTARGQTLVLRVGYV